MTRRSSPDPTGADGAAVAPDDDAVFDYIVVGAGAAGAVLAARLAEAGKRVLVLEAGDDPLAPEGGEVPPPEPPTARPLSEDCRVPAFHAFASEHRSMTWDYWVRHYDDTSQQKQDFKYYETWRDEPVDGVLYPRSSGLGGCTAHHAMIIVRPNNADWNHIWELTGDPSWRASAMQRYFQKLERCRYRFFLYRWLDRLFGWNPTGHGWDGWLQTERSLPLRTVLDYALRQSLLRAVTSVAHLLPNAADRWRWTIQGQLDPNDIRLVNAQAAGTRLPPMSTACHTRTGPRERLRAVQKRFPDRLVLRLNALVTRVEIDPTTRTVTGVVYREGSRLYAAAASPRGTPGPERVARARGEVILAGGAFNSPQLLMLSGIGDPEHLAEQGIPVLQPLPGVGRNLQDRYEVALVYKMKQPWRALRGVTYTTQDKTYRRWRRFRIGNYTSNGVLMSILLRSQANRQRPDLFCFAVLADFRGYYPSYSEAVKQTDYLSWEVLKAYTDNSAGRLRLRSADPTARPDIRFHYFEEGNDATGDDLTATVNGIKFVRLIADSMSELVEREEAPGRHLYTDEQLRQYVRDTAWGHHACGTCAMKPLAQGGVVDSAFRVYGVNKLRVVDASIFPRIPGYFIVTSIYMIAEKAADVILAQAGSLYKV